MPTQETVYRLSQDAYNILYREAQDHPELWLDPDTDFIALLYENKLDVFCEDVGVKSEGPITLELPTAEQQPVHKADIQSLAFHRNLRTLTPKLATDALMWTWMTHFRLHAYTIARWPPRPKALRDKADLTRHVVDHWFVRNQRRAIHRYNAAARTWWIAHAATTTAQASGGVFDAGQALAHFSQHPRHYHNLLDSKLSWHPVVQAEVMRALMWEAQGMKSASSDQLWKRLNLDAGTRLLGAMSREAIRNLIAGHVDDLMSDPDHVSDRARLRNRTPYRILSLGAGVQSTCLALMAEAGEYDLPKPDLAIFADTGWEPQAVYDHLDWLKTQLSFPVEVVRSGNIKENILAGRNADGSKHLGIPAFLINPDGTKGTLHRQCTTHYKLKPIHRHIKERFNIPVRSRVPKEIQIEMWLGISADETLRKKPSQEEWIDKRFPLIERNMTRAQLYDWFGRRYPGRDLPSSSCIGCPYHNDSLWRQLKENDPRAFQEAVFVDQALRDIPSVRNVVKGQAFLHRSRIPLSEVDFDSAQDYEDLIAEECEGLCRI